MESENVVAFPTASVRNWLIIEAAMQEELLRLRVADPVKARLIEKMKSFYAIISGFDFSMGIRIAFPSYIARGDVDAICADVGEKLGVISKERLNAFTDALMIDRLHREVDICRELGLL